jgi:hypothetical protein
MAGKGQPKTGGRKRGTPNQTTSAVREALLEAFHKAGGVNYLTKLATDDPRTFCSLLAKIIPSEVKADVGDCEVTLFVRDFSGMNREEALRADPKGAHPPTARLEPCEAREGPECAQPLPRVTPWPDRASSSDDSPAPPPPQRPAPVSGATYRRLWGDAERPKTAIF